jgi:hypothetical protein
MRNRITTEDLINEMPPDSQERIRKEVAKTVAKWGGKRENSGRKPESKNNVLQFTKRLNEKEVQFIDYARAHNINYDDLMQG